MDSRKRILHAAVELMTREGPAALSLREVARRAGLSHQAPYHYFENREAILAAIAEDGFERLKAALQSASGPHAAARLVAAGRAYVGFALSHPAHFHVMFRPELVNLENHSSARAAASQAFAVLQSLVGALVKEKLVPPRLKRGTVTLTWAFVQGLAGLLLEGPLARMDGGHRPTGGHLESALMAFEFLISGRAKGGPAVPE